MNSNRFCVPGLAVTVAVPVPATNVFFPEPPKI
jgi:uncharacterized membrane protein